MTWKCKRLKQKTSWLLYFSDISMPRKKSPKLPFWYRRTWSIENHIPKNRRWFWSFTPRILVSKKITPPTVGFQKSEVLLDAPCTGGWQNHDGLGNGNVAHHVWDTGKTNEWWMYFWKKWSSFLGGDRICFGSTAYNFCTFLVRIHDLKLMLGDNLDWPFSVFSALSKRLVFGGMIFFSKPSLFQWVVKSYHILFQLFLIELWVMSTHNDTHFDSKSWRFCCIGTRKKGLDEGKSLATRWGFRYLFLSPLELWRWSNLMRIWLNNFGSLTPQQTSERMPWWGCDLEVGIKLSWFVASSFFLNLKGTAPCRPWKSSFEKTPLLSTEPIFPSRKNLRLGSGIIARDPSVKVKRGQKDGSRRSNPSVNPPQGKGDRMESFQEPCWVEKTLRSKRCLRKTKEKRFWMDMFFGQRSRKPLEIER